MTVLSFSRLKWAGLLHLFFLFISKKLLKEDDVYEVKRQCLPIFLLRGETSPVVAGGICQSWRLKSPKKPVSGFCSRVSFPRWATHILSKEALLGSVNPWGVPWHYLMGGVYEWCLFPKSWNRFAKTGRMSHVRLFPQNMSTLVSGCF